MAGWFRPNTCGPIGIDIGSRSVKLLQFDREQTRVVEAARWDLPATIGEMSIDERRQATVDALHSAREGHDFRGRDAVVCLSARELFVQNVRVPKSSGAELDKFVQQEAVAKLPYPVADADLRYLEAGDVRQADSLKREVILLGCHRPVLHGLLDMVMSAGLRPVAVDVEPIAMLRSYVKQFRRDEDHTQRALFAHIGTANTAVVIACGAEILFVKYIDVGGKHFDEAIANQLGMEPAAATSLRRNNGDRRADQQDPEISQSIHDATRDVIERLVHELSLCIRYHSVTFRGQALSRLVLSGGEASSQLADKFSERLGVKCEVGDPLRTCEVNLPTHRRGQWDVAAGLALKV